MIYLNLSFLNVALNLTIHFSLIYYSIDFQYRQCLYAFLIALMNKKFIWHHGVCLAAARNGNKNNAENQTERRGGAEPSQLNRLGIGCRFFRRAILSFHCFAVMVIS